MKTRPNLKWLVLMTLALASFVPMARAYYDPAPQRWVNRDPIEERGGVGLYKFSLNDPVNWMDAEGQNPIAIPLIGLRACLANPACAAALSRALNAAAGAVAAVVISEVCRTHPRSEECDQEWEDAYRRCAEYLSRPWPPREVTGGYTSIEDCARGFVSEECGGNPTSRLRWPNSGGIINQNRPPIIIVN